MLPLRLRVACHICQSGVECGRLSDESLDRQAHVDAPAALARGVPHLPVGRGVRAGGAHDAGNRSLFLLRQVSGSHPDHALQARQLQDNGVILAHEREAIARAVKRDAKTRANAEARLNVAFVVHELADPVADGVHFSVPFGSRREPFSLADDLSIYTPIL
nr:MAG TPA: hypothetical protein [Caudoviricetes sp.]